MKTYIDRKKVGTRAELSNLASIGGLVLLLASVLLPLFLPKAANFSFVLMVAGLGTAMVGIYYANRWVRKPRPEERLDKALKGLADSYHLFHYPPLPPDHLLLTPNGVVILETISLAGSFSYKDGQLAGGHDHRPGAPLHRGGTCRRPDQERPADRADVCGSGWPK